MLFEEKYKKLNQKQKEAVDTIEGPVMVIAGPGTGKTTILTLRIANILKKTDTPPSGILALTFTDAGVKSMKMKLREVVGNVADEVRINTFHSFAGSVISEFGDHFPHLSKTTQITDVEKESIIRNILKNKKYSKLRPLGDTDFYLNKIISSISESKKEAWTPEFIESFAKEQIEQIKNSEDSISTRGKNKGELKADALKKIEKCERTILFSSVFSEYELVKKEQRKMDFDDLLFELVFALKKDELLLRLLQEKFLYVLVDEHQDSNDSQNLIIAMLADFFDTPNIFVVGDEKQAIYRFQGASVENFLRFKNTWKNMKIISLEDNYRSHQGILDAVYSMIEQNYEEDQYKDLRLPLKGIKNKKPIDLVFSPNIQSADAYLVEELKNITQKDPDKTIAVILRWNRDVDHILSICENNQLKVSAERGADIFSHPLGNVYFSILDYIYDPSNLESLIHSVASGLWNLDFEGQISLIKDIKSGKVGSIEKLIPSLSIIKDQVNNSDPLNYLMLVGNLSGLISSSRLHDPLSVEVWRSILDLSKDIISSYNIQNPRELIKILLDYKKTSENKVVKIGGGTFGAKINIMTAHSSKGLEYDYVFVPYALEEYWMKRKESSFFILPNEKSDGDEIKDSRRLFYVALTRAKENVTLIIPTSDDLGKMFTPLRFVEELDKNNLNRKEIDNHVFSNNLSDFSLNSKYKNKIVEYTKNVITENGISVTALNHYLDCPSKFLYKSILKIPEPPHPSSEKGTAMHKAISSVSANKNRDFESIRNTLESVARNYIENSFLTKLDKEVVLEELDKDIPIIAKALGDHFNLKGEIYTDKWIERYINIKTKDVSVDLRLHGQLDSMIIYEDKLMVFDYKTTKAKSINAIKGQTKNEDGGYFRQLVFYKILLEGNSLYKNKEINPSLVFIKPDESGKCPVVSLDILDSDKEDLMKDIENLVGDIFSGQFMNKKCDDPKCQFCLDKDYFLV